VTIAQDATLALHLELAATPTPGNVDRERDLPDLDFATMQAGAVGAGAGIAELAAGEALGSSFERAVEGMAEAAGQNTHFGSLLLLAPLIRAAAEDTLTPDAAASVAEATSVADATGFYRALDHVDVAVPDPPTDWDALDARRGSDAVPAVRERGVTLADVLARSAPEDLNGAEWTAGFPRTFRVADRIATDSGPLLDRAARAHLAQLAREPDTLVRTQHGATVAREVQDRARALDGAEPAEVRSFASDLVERGINPGTTADILGAGLFVALRAGVRP
jgi:triphosphoribosyl-dephospho-CoA synthase